MARRDKGHGSLTDLGSGKYALRLFIGRDPVTSRRRSVHRTVRAKNVTEARKLLAAFVLEQEGRTAGTSATVRTLMADWLRHLESVGRSPRTIAEASRTVERVINPAIGDVRLGELTTRHIDEMYRRISSLRPATRRRYHAVLSAALNQAVVWEYLSVNPAKRATVPKVRPPSFDLPTRDEAQVLVLAMRDEVYRMALRLASMTGMRRGELCALRWSDARNGVIRIRRSAYRHNGQTLEKDTKSGMERPVAIIPELEEHLVAWETWCRERAAGAGSELVADPYVLSSFPDCSRPINPDTLSARVRQVAVETGLEHIHLHSLRHLAATEMLAAGIDPRNVAAALGHADGGRLVLQVYTHPTDEIQRAAAAAMAQTLRPKELTP